MTHPALIVLGVAAVLLILWALLVRPRKSE
jgi:hypothetical protein